MAPNGPNGILWRARMQATASLPLLLPIVLPLLLILLALLPLPARGIPHVMAPSESPGAPAPPRDGTARPRVAVASGSHTTKQQHAEHTAKFTQDMEELFAQGKAPPHKPVHHAPTPAHRGGPRRKATKKTELDA
eukprot:CAMPEP_0206607018 /NCGR_PEP_ID=MMETSP0325_2-20121206/51823_1 /ASSEMBLY_ACC=CAM_ASM_000347 /TAXON_ID=2866 /ORGANISM="Crypthecodinium cohnii, Strain Seligo" /LENGTH=134 /DNA_ID=CAMNT_0054123797 /DNA_START=35 /DNA_END=436 /DNA_ORIENTATION=-